MTTWYKINILDIKIYPVTVDRVTDHRLMILGQWRNKKTEFDCFYPTFGEAKMALIKRHKELIAYHKKQLTNYELMLTEVIFMAEPERK